MAKSFMSSVAVRLALFEIVAQYCVCSFKLRRMLRKCVAATETGGPTRYCASLDKVLCSELLSTGEDFTL